MTEDRPIRAATAAVNAPLEWTGKLHCGEDEGTVQGWLFTPQLGVRIEFTGVKDPRGGGYILVGRKV